MCSCVCSAVLPVGLVFFFKQKTAYEMRISDWSSDVCSSDLVGDWGGGYMNGKGAGSFAGRQFFAGTPAIPDPGARDGRGDRDMMAIRGPLLRTMPTDGRLQLKVVTSRVPVQNQVSHSVQRVSNNAFLEPEYVPYTFYSYFYA